MRAVIADHTLPHTVEQLGIVAGIFAAGAAYALGQWRRGRADHVSTALSIANDELDVLKGARDRMGAELRSSGERISALEAIVEQLRQENAALRELVMLESVPPALRAALAEHGETAAAIAAREAERQHEETRARILAELAEIEQRLDRLLEGKGTP